MCPCVCLYVCTMYVCSMFVCNTMYVWVQFFVDVPGSTAQPIGMIQKAFDSCLKDINDDYINAYK